MAVWVSSWFSRFIPNTKKLPLVVIDSVAIPWVWLSYTVYNFSTINFALYNSEIKEKKSWTQSSNHQHRNVNRELSGWSSVFYAAGPDHPSGGLALIRSLRVVSLKRSFNKQLVYMAVWLNISHFFQSTKQTTSFKISLFFFLIKLDSFLWQH